MTSDLDSAEAILRPAAASLAAAWAVAVRAERLQVEALPDRPRPEDFYQPIAESFRGEPERPDDAVLAALLTLAAPSETWLDLGAGGGRYAVPLSRRVAKVIAIEPSAGMRRVLAESIERSHIENIEVYPERWPGESAAPVADAGMIVHVGYDIEAIGPFLDQLEAHSRRLCAAVLFEPAPISDFAPLWPAVHGEARVLLPALPELIRLLLARGALPEVRVLTLPPRFYPAIPALHRAARRPLWVLENSEKDEQLARAIQEMAVPFGEGVVLGPQQRHLGIVTWEPRSTAQ
jgi:SAM-dependent methyltransferase